MGDIKAPRRVAHAWRRMFIHSAGCEPMGKTGGAETRGLPAPIRGSSPSKPSGAIEAKGFDGRGLPHRKGTSHMLIISRDHAVRLSQRELHSALKRLFNERSDLQDLTQKRLSESSITHVKQRLAKPRL